MTEMEHLPLADEIERYEAEQFRWFHYKLFGAVLLLIIGLIALASL